MSGQLVKKSVFSKKVLVLNPYPQTPFPGKGAILLGLPPLDPVGGYAPATPFLSTIEVFRLTVTALNERFIFIPYNNLPHNRRMTAENKT